MDEASVAILAAPPWRLAPVGAPEAIGPLAELLLSLPAGPRLALHLGMTAPGRNALYFLDHGRAEEMSRKRLTRLAADGALHELRPRGLVWPAPLVAARYAARHRVAPESAAAHIAGRLEALRAVGRELARLGAERPGDEPALEAAHGRLGRLHSEAAAQAQALIDAPALP